MYQVCTFVPSFTKQAEVIDEHTIGDAYKIKQFLVENPKFSEATIVQEGLITYNFPVEYHYEYSWVIDLGGKLYNVLLNEGHWYYRTRSRKEVKICRYYPEGTPKRTRRYKPQHEYSFKRPWELNKGSGKYRNDCQIWTISVCLGISYDESYELLAAKGWSENSTGNEWRNDWKGIFASKGKDLTEYWSKWRSPESKAMFKACTVGNLTKKLPKTGTFAVSTRNHVLSVVDGVIIDSCFRPLDRVIKIYKIN